jgi:hypothetical protein
MLKILFFILVFASSTILALAQTEEKPKAYLFDEFNANSRVEVKTRIEKLKKKLQETAWTDKPVGAYLMFFSDEKKKPSFNIERLVRDTLFNNCRDCLGLSPRIVFVNVGKSKEQKVQFWLVPVGAEPPELENKD